MKRYSTGIHDPLYSSSLYLDDGTIQVLFIANDIIFIDKEMTRRVRGSVSLETVLPRKNVLISAIHTHSGPMTVDYISNRLDSAVPKPDQEYIDFLIE